MKARKPIIQFKQHITQDLKIDNTTPLHPPTHSTDNLTIVQGSGHQINAKQNIIEKNDINGIGPSKIL